MPEFDGFPVLENDPERRAQLRDYVRGGVSPLILARAMTGASLAADFFLESLDPERPAECRLARDCPARQMDIEAARREMLALAKVWRRGVT